MQRQLLTALFGFLVLSSCAEAQVPGCTDPLATNFNSAATENDGTCVYASATVTPSGPVVLGDTLNETSGLLWWDDKLWTHVDNTDTTLYAIDTLSGSITNFKRVTGVTNNDWEEITQDDDYIYIGNFGNNGSGNRQDMHILRIAKANASDTIVNADTIAFHYEDQTDFTGTTTNNTNFDCEAFIATSDSLYLFSKQWINKKTRVYALPKTPGNYVAQLKDSFDVQGLITGAHYQPDRRTIVLSGYTISGFSLAPFAYLLYDFTSHNFFSGNKRKININAPLHQVEGISSIDGNTFYISNEKIANSAITITPKLQKINLAPYLSGYYQTLSVAQPPLTNASVNLFPNPVSESLSFTVNALKTTLAQVHVVDGYGKAISAKEIMLNAGTNTLNLDMPVLSNGIYWLKLAAEGVAITKKFAYQGK